MRGMTNHEVITLVPLTVNEAIDLISGFADMLFRKVCEQTDVDGRMEINITCETIMKLFRELDMDGRDAAAICLQLGIEILKTNPHYAPSRVRFQCQAEKTEPLN
jgi:hypothetical protein